MNNVATELRRIGKSLGLKQAPACNNEEPRLKLISTENRGHFVPKIRNLPTLAINHHKGRFLFNKIAIELMGLTNTTGIIWVAMYQDECVPSNWYIALEDVNGAIPCQRTKDTSMQGHSKKVAGLLCDAQGVKGQNSSFLITKAHGKYFKVGPVLRNIGK